MISIDKDEYDEDDDSLTKLKMIIESDLKTNNKRGRN